MQEIIDVICVNLNQVGIGALLFLCAYASNMMLGAWKNVKIDGSTFDWSKILQSCVKFIVLGLGIAILSMVVAIMPVYIEYIGIEVAPETLESIDAIVIVGAFLTAAIKYVMDSLNKIKTALGFSSSQMSVSENSSSTK